LQKFVVDRTDAGWYLMTEDDAWLPVDLGASSDDRKVVTEGQLVQVEFRFVEDRWHAVVQSSNSLGSHNSSWDWVKVLRAFQEYDQTFHAQKLVTAVGEMS
jgi:hypothetical protein